MTDLVQAGDSAPDFRLPAINIPGDVADSQALRGRPYVLFFYPKADTPGCTREACDFQSALAEVGHGIGAALTVIGVSKDKVPALTRFAGKYGLGFPLASDESTTTIAAYGAWVEKTMYGRTSMGIERSTFLIGADGRIAQVWRKVKVEGHVASVLEAAAALISPAGGQ